MLCDCLLWEAHFAHPVLGLTAKVQQFSIFQDRKDVPGDVFPDTGV